MKTMLYKLFSFQCPFDKRINVTPDIHGTSMQQGLSYVTKIPVCLKYLPVQPVQQDFLLHLRQATDYIHQNT